MLSAVKQYKNCLDCFAVEDGTDKFSRKVGNYE
jgi:hypothetical protein